MSSGPPNSEFHLLRPFWRYDMEGSFDLWRAWILQPALVLLKNNTRHNRCLIVCEFTAALTVLKAATLSV